MLGYALNRYLENANNNLVKFSLILQVQNWYPGWVHGGNETIPQEAARFVTYFQKSIHHKTRDGRPIVRAVGCAFFFASFLLRLPLRRFLLLLPSPQRRALHAYHPIVS